MRNFYDYEKFDDISEGQSRQGKGATHSLVNLVRLHTMAATAPPFGPTNSRAVVPVVEKLVGASTATKTMPTVVTDEKLRPHCSAKGHFRRMEPSASLLV